MGCHFQVEEYAPCTNAVDVLCAPRQVWVVVAAELDVRTVWMPGTNGVIFCEVGFAVHVLWPVGFDAVIQRSLGFVHVGGSVIDFVVEDSVEVG